MSNQVSTILDELDELDIDEVTLPIPIRQAHLAFVEKEDQKAQTVVRDLGREMAVDYYYFLLSERYS